MTARAFRAHGSLRDDALVLGVGAGHAYAGGHRNRALDERAADAHAAEFGAGRGAADGREGRTELGRRANDVVRLDHVG